MHLHWLAVSVDAGRPGQYPRIGREVSPHLHIGRGRAGRSAHIYTVGLGRGGWPARIYKVVWGSGWVVGPDPQGAPGPGLGIQAPVYRRERVGMGDGGI